MGLFSKKTTTTAEEMLTPEQKQAQSLLMQFGTTGMVGDFQAGQGYDFSGYNFGLNPTELAGGSALESLMASGTGLDPARKAYEGILGQTFNPDDPSNEFAAFNRMLAKQTQGASDVLNREAAITGGRFGTGIQKQKQELATNQSDIAASKLAELYSQLQQNKLGAASGLTALSGMQENINQGRIQSAFQYGQQQRDIQNQKAQMAYDDWQRARSERMSSISGLESVWGRNVQYGQKSVTTSSPTLLGQLASSVLSGVGTAAGGALGGIVGGGITSMFAPKPVSSVPSSSSMASMLMKGL